MPSPSCFYIIVGGGDGGGDRDGRDNEAMSKKARRKHAQVEVYNYLFFVICLFLCSFRVRARLIWWAFDEKCRSQQFEVNAFLWTATTMYRRRSGRIVFFFSRSKFWINALPICAAIRLREHITHRGRIKVLTCYIANTRGCGMRKEISGRMFRTKGHRRRSLSSVCAHAGTVYAVAHQNNCL